MLFIFFRNSTTWRRDDKFVWAHRFSLIWSVTAGFSYSQRFQEDALGEVRAWESFHSRGNGNKVREWAATGTFVTCEKSALCMKWRFRWRSVSVNWRCSRLFVCLFACIRSSTHTIIIYRKEIDLSNIAMIAQLQIWAKWEKRRAGLLMCEDDDYYTWVLSVCRSLLQFVGCLDFTQTLFQNQTTCRPQCTFTASPLSFFFLFLFTLLSLTHTRSHDIRTERFISLQEGTHFKPISLHRSFSRTRFKAYLWGGSTWLKSCTG